MESVAVPNRQASTVLVHGAWADGSSWSRVIRSLRARGVRTYAAQLPLTSVADDVAAVERLIDRVPGPVVLVGHAYAGAVIGSVRSDKVIGLVYVAALAPAEGESAGDVFTRAQPHPRAPALEPDSHGYVWLPDTAFPDAFAQDATPEDHTVLAAAQRPIAAHSIGTPVGRPLWVDRPSWYVVAENDRMIAPETQRFMAQRMNARIHSLRSDHSPMTTAPEDLAAVLQQAVTDLH